MKRATASRAVNEETVQVNVILHRPFTAIELAGNVGRDALAVHHAAVFGFKKDGGVEKVRHLRLGFLVLARTEIEGDGTGLRSLGVGKLLLGHLADAELRHGGGELVRFGMPAGFLGTTLLFGLLAGLGLFLEGLADLLEVGEVVDDWHL